MVCQLFLPQDSVYEYYGWVLVGICPSPRFHCLVAKQWNLGSWLTNFGSCHGRKSFWQMHGRASGAWWLCFMWCHSLIHQGSSKEAHTFQASSWWSSTSEILASSGHQSGILCACACQVTHLSYSSTGGSGEDLFPSSSSKLPTSSWRKQSTSGPNSGGGSRSKSRRSGLASPSSPDPGPHWGGLHSKKGAGLSSGQALWCLLLHPWDLLLQWSWLQA